jgi:hypothetical protein
MLFKEIIAVYSKNHTKAMNTKCRVTELKHVVCILSITTGLQRVNE